MIGVRSAFEDRAASFAFPASPIWKVAGPIGPHSLTARALDLLDLVGALYRVESAIPSRLTNPAKEWQIVAPVRDLSFWTRQGGQRLASVLGFLNRARWSFAFEARSDAPDIEVSRDKARVVKEIILFSGGMDSACGAGIHQGRKQVQLVSFYTNQRKLQQELANDLGYAPPTQWRLQGRRGKEGMNLIRALVFLSIGAAVAKTFGASRLLQYENGFLAAAIPPSGNFVPTRHAHPEFHRRLLQLLDAVFEQKLQIDNPFEQITKREACRLFKKAVGTELSERVLRKTQTCWHLAQAHVAGRSKRPGVPCGVCTPCIVRLTARPREMNRNAWKGWRGCACDLRKSSVRNNRKLGLTFRAYLELIDIALSYSDDRTMIEELAPEAQVLVDGPTGPSHTSVAAVLRRFAKEFCETFEITTPHRKR